MLTMRRYYFYSIPQLLQVSPEKGCSLGYKHKKSRQESEIFLWFRSGLCDSVAIIEGCYLKFCSKRLCISDIYLSLAWFSLLFFCLFLLGLHLVCRQIWFAVLLVCLLDKDTKSGSYFQISQLCFCVICSREVLYLLTYFYIFISGL